MKTSLKNRRGILLNFFAIIPIRHVTWNTWKTGIFGDEDRGPQPSSDKDGRIYLLADPFLNLSDIDLPRAKALDNI